MRKIKLTFVLAMILFIAGCKKTTNDMQANISDVIPITNQSAAKQVAYAETNLKKIGAEIAKLTKDPAFVSFVHSEVNKKFDEEYEVLIEDLKKNSIWGNKLNSKNLNDGLSAFKNVGGVNGGNYFPQIFIPKFQNDEEQNNFSSSSLIGKDSILFLIYGGDPEVDSATSIDREYPAYVIDTAGYLTFWGNVDEEYSNTHEVWVFSINEAVNKEGRLQLPCLDEEGNLGICGGGTGGGGGSGTGGGGGGNTNPDNDPIDNFRPNHPTIGNPNNFLVNFKIQNMIVKDHKESWVSGQSEISIRAVLNCHNNLELGNPTPAPNTQYKSDQASLLTGQLIKKFKRKQVRNETTVLLNYTLQTQWPSRFRASDPIFFDYVIFEKDSWPATEKTNDMITRPDLFWNPAGNPFSPNWTLNYRSNNPNGTTWGEPYDKSYFSSNNLVINNQNEFYQSGLRNRPGIKFNTVGF